LYIKYKKAWYYVKYILVSVAKEKKMAITSVSERLRNDFDYEYVRFVFMNEKEER